MIDKVGKDACVGCKACGDICPQDAIQYETGKDGFWHPKIDMDKCVQCNLCEKACPVLYQVSASVKGQKPKVYAAYCRDINIRYNSTSGGMYYALAKTFLDAGGVLVGCAYTEDYDHAVHMVARDDVGLKKLMRSKYFQSDTEGIYKAISNLLQAGEKVLFSGSPCQIAALYNFLRRKTENLYTVDYVCRGINSPLAYKKYVEEICQKYHSGLQEVHFKNKSHGWTNLGTRVVLQNGKVYYRNRFNDPWVNGFIVGNLYMRPSCEQCHYKKLPRISDLSFGDFWGKKFTLEEAQYGLSLAMVNTSKGEELLASAKNLLVLKEDSLELALQGNPAILHPVKIDHAKREEFFARIENEPFSKVVWSLVGIGGPRRLLNMEKAKIRRFLHIVKSKVLSNKNGG